MSRWSDFRKTIPHKREQRIRHNTDPKPNTENTAEMIEAALQAGLEVQRLPMHKKSKLDMRRRHRGY